MDAKIQKYARRCEFAAWALIGLAFFQWIFKWVADWVIYLLSQFGGFDLTKYGSLAEAFKHLSCEQLNKISFVEKLMHADFGESWIGLSNLVKLSWTSRFLGFLCDGVAVGIMVLGFWLFVKLMKQLTKGSVFSIEVIELLNKIAKVIFWFAVYVPIGRILISLLIAFTNPPGQRCVAVTLLAGDIFVLAASWFFVILTALMRESRELQSERDLTV